MTFEFGSDEEIKSLGEYLRRRRQGRDLSLEEVAEKIKIHIKYLAAIEDGKDAELPGPVYKELFVKSYCEFLGVSIDELLLRLPEQAPVPEEEGNPDQTETVKERPRVVAPAPDRPRTGPAKEWRWPHIFGCDSRSIGYSLGGCCRAGLSGRIVQQDARSTAANP